MSSFSSMSLPKPKNWQDFEASIRYLFSCILDDPNTQANGRSGQKQDGVDIYGLRNKQNFVGIQCKKKFETSISEKELRDEVEKAKSFMPPLSEFFMVTTVSRDAKIQATARKISDELKGTAHSMQVIVWGWEDIEEQASLYKSAWRAFDPTWNPYAEKLYDEFLQIKDMITKKSSSFQDEVPRPNNMLNHIEIDVDTDDNTPLCSEIALLQKLINKGLAQIALESLTQLEHDKWDNASRLEKYKLIVTIAMAELRLGDTKKGGLHLCKAYDQFSDHKDAKRNLITGLLLVDKYEEAAREAKVVLEHDENNSYIASLLIQALAYHNLVADPLDLVPSKILDSEEVRIAYTQFLRIRKDNRWTRLALETYSKYPNSEHAKLQYSEAVLHIASANKDFLFGGKADLISYNDLVSASEHLYAEACKELSYTSDLSVSTLSNAALALRWTDQNAKAKDVLDKAISIYPTEINLVLQRSIISFMEKDYEKVLSLLPREINDPQALVLKLKALVELGRLDDATTLIEENSGTPYEDEVFIQIVFVQTQIYVKKNNTELAIGNIRKHITNYPGNILFSTLLVSTFISLNRKEEALKSLNDLLELVNDEVDLQTRLAICHEAEDLKQYSIVVTLLKDKVSLENDNEVLRQLVLNCINSNQLYTANAFLNAITSASIRKSSWFLKSAAMIALKTGDDQAPSIIENYLINCPNDIQMILALISTHQANNDSSKIKKILDEIDLDKLEGKPEYFIALAKAITVYDNYLKGLEYGYSLLMNYWDNEEIHTGYLSLILFGNSTVRDKIPSPATIKNDAVVCIKTENTEHIFRFEDKKYTYFEEERIGCNSELYGLLLGKKTGETFVLNYLHNTKQAEIMWIKPKYIHLFHKSLAQYNVLFPNATGIASFTFNEQDPLHDITIQQKKHSEYIQTILDAYKAYHVPLVFITQYTGKDIIDVYNGLKDNNVSFRICMGNSLERTNATHQILSNKRKGCIVDVLTLYIIKKFGFRDVIRKICGPIHTTQSVVDFYALRELEFKSNLGRIQGYLVYKNDRLSMVEYTEEMKQIELNEREEMSTWVRNNTSIVLSLAKEELTPETRTYFEMMDHVSRDIICASSGCDLLLLSEDFGTRNIGINTIKISSTWLQPVLSLALSQEIIDRNDYNEYLIQTHLSGGSYISFDSTCLYYQAHKDNFELSDVLCSILDVVGGINADINSNCKVIASFFDMLASKCLDQYKVKIILSYALSAFLRSRGKESTNIVEVIISNMVTNYRYINEHLYGWLVGHLFGSSNSDVANKMFNYYRYV